MVNFILYCLKYERRGPKHAPLSFRTKGERTHGPVPSCIMAYSIISFVEIFGILALIGLCASAGLLRPTHPIPDLIRIASLATTMNFLAMASKKDCEPILPTPLLE